MVATQLQEPIKVEIRARDFRVAIARLIFRPLYLLGSLLVNSLFILGALVVVSWDLPPSENPEFWNPLLRPSSLLTGVAVLGGLVLVERISSVIRLTNRAASSSPFPRRWTLHLSGNGVHVVAPSEEVRYYWSALHRAVETRSAFLLLMNKDATWILPKRCLRDAAQIEACRDLMRRKLGPRAKLHRAKSGFTRGEQRRE